MGPRERRLIRRLMIFASILVTLMVATMMWLATQQSPRAPSGGSQSGESSSQSGGGSP